MRQGYNGADPIASAGEGTVETTACTAAGSCFSGFASPAGCSGSCFRFRTAILPGASAGFAGTAKRRRMGMPGLRAG